MCKTTLSSDESKFEILFGTHGRHNLQTKEERRYLGCYQCSVQKPAVLMVSRCIGVYGIDSLHIWNAHQCFPKTSFSGKALHLSASYSKLHSVAIRAIWLYSRRFRWPFTNRKHHETKHTQECWESRLIYQTRMGQCSSSKKSRSCSPEQKFCCL